MKEIIRRLLRRDNILAIVLVITALLGIIGVPQKVGVTSDQILLALLAVLASDMLIERLGYLDRVESRIADLGNKIEPSADNMFRTRDEMGGEFRLWLQGCEEMWLLGRDLYNVLSSYGERIAQAAREDGKRFRFLLVDPDNSALMGVISVSSAMRPDALSRARTVRGSLTYLERMLKNTPGGAIEVKLANWMPTNSYMIVDERSPDGRMIVEMFGYKISAGARLHLSLTRAADKRTFEFHLKQFKHMWKDAKSWPEKPLK